MYDEIYRVPLIVRYPPLVPPGGICRTPVGSLALMPTILELAGVPRPPGLHAESLVASLADPESAPVEGAAFAEYHGEEWGLYSQRMIRTAETKYVYSPHGSDELYDLAADPHELTNLIDDSAHSGLLAALRERLRRWMTETGDPLARWMGRLY
jgi:arylsulfatase A-like enzyme